MKQPPLNPDALRVATKAAHDAVDWQMYDVTKSDLEDSVDVATIAAVSAYLAVAKPEVNSVEELDQLPCASVVLNGVTAFQKYGAREPFDWSADGRWYDSTQVELPARVLYIPEVNDGR